MIGKQGMTPRRPRMYNIFFSSGFGNRSNRRFRLTLDETLFPRGLRGFARGERKGRSEAASRMLAHMYAAAKSGGDSDL